VRLFRPTALSLAGSARVAAVVASVIAALYAGVAVTFDSLEAHHLIASVDMTLADRARELTAHSSPRLLDGHLLPPDPDIDDAPTIVWYATGSHHVVALTAGAPRLPPGAWSRSGRPSTARLGASEVRLQSTRALGGWLVVGQSLAETDHVEQVVDRAETVAGPVLVLAMFLGSLLIGTSAARPVEQARQRQLDFTADASHELRTPLTVIGAEVDLALSSPRDAQSYRAALEVVGHEAGRLRQIVGDLLFLARSDAAPPPPGQEAVDIVTMAESCTQRFSSVAHARGVELRMQAGGSAALVKAPPSWVDRLVGVLLDNACRYAGPGGTVLVSVRARGNTVALSVEDSGPGVPVEERPLLFDRFHRATDLGEGAGLGLAIADTVVRATAGRWRVGDSELGGALMEVSWRRLHSRDTA